MGCGCNKNNNKKLNIENMKNMSLDDILRLYKEGYRLDENIVSTQSSGIYNTQNLQSSNTLTQPFKIHPFKTHNMRSHGIYNMRRSEKIFSMPSNNLTIVNPPSAVPGQSVTFTIMYDLYLGSITQMEVIRFRICYAGQQIGHYSPWLPTWGHITGSVDVVATFPQTGMSNSANITAEVTIYDWSSACQDAGVFASTNIAIPVITQATNGITMLNPPSSVKPGWNTEFQLSYNLYFDPNTHPLGEIVKFRICANGNEIGSNIQILYGNAIGTITVSTTMPTNISSTASIKAEVTTNELSWTCGDSGVIASDGPRTISVGQTNTISLINRPQSVISGQPVDFTINYGLNVSGFGEWVKFRICSNGVQLGANNELLFGNDTGVITVKSAIPLSAVGTIPIIAEVTTDELSDTCSDPDVMTTDGPFNINVIAGTIENTINITNMPTEAAPGQDIVFTLDYNLSSLQLPETVRFRICANGLEIGNTTETLYFNNIGNTVVTTRIPNNATTSILLKAEVTTDQSNPQCGDAGVIAITQAVSIPISGNIVATHYAEYDMSFLPTAFLDLIASNIVDISDTIGPYLPLPSDIGYVASEYIDGKFRLYVTYASSLSLSSQAQALRLDMQSNGRGQNGTYYYNTNNGNINNGRVETLQTSLEMFFGLVAGIIIFVLLARMTIKFGPYGILASAIVGVIGAVLTTFAIVEITSGSSTQGETPPITPEQKIETVQEYYDKYLTPACEELYQGCGDSPPTCDVNTMRAYIGCVGGAKYAQCQHAAATAGQPADSCESIKTAMMDVDTCLDNGTCSPQDAMSRLNTLIAEANANIEQNLQTVTCPSGETYDLDTTSCVPVENCTIRNPFGGCIISQETASSVMMIGAILLGGFVLFKVAPKVMPIGTTERPRGTPA